MNFKPQTEQQIRDSLVVATGTYPFTFRAAADKLPPGGTETIEVSLAISHGGHHYTVKDSLSANKMKKLREAAVSCGLLDRYNAGNIAAADFLGKSGYARIVLYPARGDYSEKNVVAAYVSRGLAR